MSAAFTNIHRVNEPHVFLHVNLLKCRFLSPHALVVVDIVSEVVSSTY
jgi:hypothetical protein